MKKTLLKLALKILLFQCEFQESTCSCQEIQETLMHALMEILSALFYLKMLPELFHTMVLFVTSSYFTSKMPFEQGTDASLNGRDPLWTRLLESFLLRMFQTIFLGELVFLTYISPT